MRNKRMMMTAAAILAGLAITACGNQAAESAASSSAAASVAASEAASEDASESASDAEAASSEVAASEAEESSAAAEAESQSSALKVSDDISDEQLKELYHAFGESLQIAMADKSMTELSELMSYPCYIGIDGGVTVKDEAEFMELDANKLFDPALLEAVAQANLDAIEVTEAGYVVGDPSGTPNVTIGLDENGAIGITGINY